MPQKSSIQSDLRSHKWCVITLFDSISAAAAATLRLDFKSKRREKKKRGREGGRGEERKGLCSVSVNDSLS